MSESTLALDLDLVAARIAEVRQTLGLDELYYSVKTNSHRGVLLAVDSTGAGFDIASFGEARILHDLGIDGDRMVHGAPIRSASDARSCLELGIRHFVVDSASGLDGLTGVPGVKATIRIAVPGGASRWHLSEKFGASATQAVRLAEILSESGVAVEGISFHVGSQAENNDVWSIALCRAARIWERLVALGVQPRTLNLGGGFPARYHEAVGPLSEVAGVIHAGLARHFSTRPRLAAEPGRYIVAEAGSLRTEVLAIERRNGHRWIYLECGGSNGLFEASRWGGGLVHPMRLAVRQPSHAETEPTTFAGSSCDGDDVLGAPRHFTTDVTIGDVVLVEKTGAYSLGYNMALCGLTEPRVVPRTNRLEATIGPLTLARIGADSPLLEQATALELRTFSAAGFLGECGTLDEYRAYDQQSTFTVAQRNSRIVGVLREIHQGRRPLKTLSDFRLHPIAEAFLAEADGEVREIGTLATDNEDPLGRTGAILISSAWKSAVAHGVRYWVTSVDTRLLHAVRSYFGFDFIELGPPKHYFGSETSPVVLDLHTAGRRCTSHRASFGRLLRSVPLLGEPTSVRSELIDLTEDRTQRPSMV